MFYRRVPITAGISLFPSSLPMGSGGAVTAPPQRLGSRSIKPFGPGGRKGFIVLVKSLLKISGPHGSEMPYAVSYGFLMRHAYLKAGENKLLWVHLSANSMRMTYFNGLLVLTFAIS
jgi:hypothetical protein